MTLESEGSESTRQTVEGREPHMSVGDASGAERHKVNRSKGERITRACERRLIKRLPGNKNPLEEEMGCAHAPL